MDLQALTDSYESFHKINYVRTLRESTIYSSIFDNFLKSFVSLLDSGHILIHDMSNIENNSFPSKCIATQSSPQYAMTSLEVNGSSTYFW